MYEGDIFACQKHLSGLLKQQKPFDEHIVSVLSGMITKFSTNSFIPVEYSEKLLTSTGNIMERCVDENVLVKFAIDESFVGGLINVVKTFENRIKTPTPLAGNSSSFSSHYCYELTLFMLLGLMDKAAILKMFVSAIGFEKAFELVGAISTIIIKDYLYLTQEVGLEIVCRLSHYFLQKTPGNFQVFSKNFPPLLRAAIDRSSKIPELLRNMRPLLTTVNKTNPNVFSLPTLSFGISTTWKKVDTQRVINEEGWIDICKDHICFNLQEQEVLLRFSYSDIKKIHFSDDTSGIQVLLHSCVGKLQKLLHKAEVPPPGHCPVMIFELSNAGQDLGTARTVIEMRMIEHETVKLDGVKYSVVTSRDNGPATVAQAVENMQNPLGIGVTGSAHFVSPKSSSTLPQVKAATSKKRPKTDDSPSSISSPDMEVPSVDSVIGHLPNHNPGPDSLLAFAKPVPPPSSKIETIPRRPTPVKVASNRKGQKAKAIKQTKANNKHGASKSRVVLSKQLNPSVTVKQNAASRTTASLKSVHAHDKENVPENFLDYDSNHNDNFDNWAGDEPETPKRDFTSEMPAKKLSKPPIDPHSSRRSALPAETLQSLPAYATPTITKSELHQEKLKVVPAQSSDLTARATKRTTKRTTAVDPPNSLVHVSIQADSISLEQPSKSHLLHGLAGTGTARMRTPSAQNDDLSKLDTIVSLKKKDDLSNYTPASKVRSGAKLKSVDHHDSSMKIQKEITQFNDEKGNAQAPYIESSSPGPSQAQSMSSKRKFGRTIQPVAITGADWMELKEPISTEKEDAVSKRRKSAVRKIEATASEKRNRKNQTLTLSKSTAQSKISEQLKTINNNDGTKTSLLVQHSTKKARMHTPTPSIAPAPSLHLADYIEDNIYNVEDAGNFDDAFDVKSVLRSPSPEIPTTSLQRSKEVVGHTWRKISKSVVDSAELSIEAVERAKPIVPDSAQIVVESFTQVMQKMSQVSVGTSAFGQTQESNAKVLDVEDPFSEKQNQVKSAKQQQTHRQISMSRKRKAMIDPLSDEELDNDYDTQTDKNYKQASDDISFSEEPSGSSYEENEVVAVLLKEVMSMQKERAKRKRARMLTGVGNAATKQVVAFLQQWREFSEHSCSEMQRSVNVQLEHLCSQADTLCGELGKDAESFAVHDRELDHDLKQIEREAAELKESIVKSVAQNRAEEAEVKNGVTSLRNRALVAAKKTLSMQKDMRHHSGKQQSLELLKALRET